MPLIDLHSHTFFSDGELVPAEHLRRVEVLGYEAIAITDHVDSSNLDFVLPRIIKAAADLNKHSKTKLIAGIELTHVPPAMIDELTIAARQMGAQLVVVHGETIVEPVAPGTNMSAIQAGVDILAHPGFITEQEVELAVKEGVFLELSGRKGHSLTNGHVAQLARKFNASLVVNSDGHGPGDFMTNDMARNVALGAGLNENEYGDICRNMQSIVNKM